MEQQVEATLTVGNALAKQLLDKNDITSIPSNGVGPGQIIPVEISDQLFAFEANGERIPAEKVRLYSDGLEVNLTVFYPRPTADLFRLRAQFVRHLPPASFTALICTDENSNILGSHIVKAGSETAELGIPQLPGATGKMPTIATGMASEADDASVVAASGVSSTPTPQSRPHPPFADYFQMGLQHILSGPDHLLFLCGLLVVSRKIGGMVAIITCFTLAHSVTLGLAALNIVSLPARIIEPVIAASIIAVGVENFRRGDGAKARYWLAFGFGLIHGFGLADALRDVGLGSTISSLVTGLFSFNLGVEIGQLFVATVFLAVLWQLRKLKPVERYATSVISVIVIALGCWWLVQRTLLS